MRFFVLAAAAVALAGCQTIGSLPSLSIPPRDAQAAISAFDAAEVAAAGYLRLPLCGAAPCRTQAVSAKLVTAIRDGRKIRAYVEAQLAANNGGPIGVTNFTGLQNEVAFVQSILGGY